MINSKVNIAGQELIFKYEGWKYYNQIKKKAMEQEFSWAGLVLSLSIAFFIVIFTSLMLSGLNNFMIKEGIMTGRDNSNKVEINQSAEYSNSDITNFVLLS